MIKKHIPNTITCLNLTSGAVAACMVLTMPVEVAYIYALLLVILAAVFDFFDGMSARALHVSSPIGKELDSLADDISFGLVPGVALLRYLSEYPIEGWSHCFHVLALLIPALSAVRLAKFNLDERQTSSFIGMPTPANSLFWLSLLATLSQYNCTSSWLFYLLAAGAVILSWLLVAEFPMFSLKFHNLSWKDNRVAYLFLICAVGTILAGVILKQVLVIPAVIIGVYLLFNVVLNLVKK